MAVGEGNMGDNGKRIPVTLKIGSIVLLPEFGG